MKKKIKPRARTRLDTAQRRQSIGPLVQSVLALHDWDPLALAVQLEVSEQAVRSWLEGRHGQREQRASCDAAARERRPRRRYASCTGCCVAGLSRPPQVKMGSGTWPRPRAREQVVTSTMELIMTSLAPVPSTCLACGRDLSVPLPGCLDCKFLAPPPAALPRPPPSETRAVPVPRRHHSETRLVVPAQKKEPDA